MNGSDIENTFKNKYVNWVLIKIINRSINQSMNVIFVKKKKNSLMPVIKCANYKHPVTPYNVICSNMILSHLSYILY